MIPDSPTLVIIAGLLLIIIGIIGGGLKIKEISVPTIGKIARTGAFVVGFVLLIFGMVMHEPESDFDDGPGFSISDTMYDDNDYESEEEFDDSTDYEDAEYEEDSTWVDENYEEYWYSEYFIKYNHSEKQVLL